jgi:DNA recombination-dependent growth factor C
MWFKNLRLYRLTEQWTLSPEELNERLGEHSFNPCGNLDMMRLWLGTAIRQARERICSCCQRFTS